MADASIKDFEAAIAELEAVVKKLEEGDLPLEQSLELYERGVQLSRFCHARLEEAERRHILKALEKTGGVLAGPRGAAALLGLNRSTLWSRMKKLGIQSPES